MVIKSRNAIDNISKVIGAMANLILVMPDLINGRKIDPIVVAGLKDVP